MNSNGIPEMIRAAGKSSYRTPRMPWWGWLLIIMWSLAIFKAYASPACMTYTEARQVWPTKYLHWHGEHCWSYEHREYQHVERIPLPKERPFIPVQEWIYAERWWIS